MSDPPLSKDKNTHLLSPPGRPPEQNGKQRQNVLPLAVWTALALLLCLAAAVVWILPGIKSLTPLRQDSKTAPSLSVFSKKAAPSSTSFKKKPEAAKDALDARKRCLGQKARAKLLNMPAWGGKDYQDALGLADRASSFLKEKRYTLAAETFSEASEVLSGLERKKDLILEKALADGENALKLGLSEEAKTNFLAALAIDPQNSRAQRGLQRTKNAGKVHELILEGKAELEGGRVQEAASAFSRALRLDPDSREAAGLLKEARDTTTRKNFERAMGEALSAFSENRLSEAGRALKSASSIYPDNPAVQDLARRLSRAERHLSLQKYLDEAGRLTEQEKWKEAAAFYKKALDIDPDNVTALGGLEKAERLSATMKILQGIIDHPERLREPGPLKDAKKALEAARGIKEPGPVLSGRIKQASMVVENALRPVAVTILSDGKTDITIYRAGRLGRVYRRTIFLRPGRYVALGTRQGFRDVRREIEVKSAGLQPAFSIVCSERI